MRFLRVNGHDMAYVERGAGTPLLLVHGALCDLRYWAPQVEAFGRRHRAIAPSLRQFGRRHRAIAPSLRHFWPERWDGAGDGFTIRRHAEDVAAGAGAL